MGIDLASAGFAIENEWYWRISENATSFDAPGAVRDFLAPLARVAKSTIAITGVVADGDEVRFQVGDNPSTITIAGNAPDRVAVSQFVTEINRALADAKQPYVFALVVPRRYELRGVLLRQDQIAGLIGDPVLMIPSGRPSWRTIPT